MASIPETQAWYVASEQTPEQPAGLNPKLAARHMGWQMITLGRKMSLLSTPMGAWLQQYGELFVNGHMDQLLEQRATGIEVRNVLLQYDMELIFRTIGAALGLGTTNVGGAYQAIVENYWAMEHSDGAYKLDKQGVPLPPAGWAPPDLKGFLK